MHKGLLKLSLSCVTILCIVSWEGKKVFSFMFFMSEFPLIPNP